MIPRSSKVASQLNPLIKASTLLFQEVSPISEVQDYTIRVSSTIQCILQPRSVPSGQNHKYFSLSVFCVEKLSLERRDISFRCEAMLNNSTRCLTITDVVLETVSGGEITRDNIVRWQYIG